MTPGLHAKYAVKVSEMAFRQLLVGTQSKLHIYQKCVQILAKYTHFILLIRK